MPSTSKAQHNFMAAVAHSPAFAKKAGVPMSVGKDFNNADKGKTFKQGGDMATKMNPGFMAMMSKKKDGMHKMPDGKMMKNSAMKMAEGGSTESGGRGVTTVPGDKKLGSPSRYVTKILPSGSKPLTQQRPEKEGSGFKSGGMAYAKGGGIESKGKTKGKQIKMMGGGKC